MDEKEGRGKRRKKTVASDSEDDSSSDDDDDLTQTNGTASRPATAATNGTNGAPGTRGTARTRAALNSMAARSSRNRRVVADEEIDSDEEAEIYDASPARTSQATRTSGRTTRASASQSQTAMDVDASEDETPDLGALNIAAMAEAEVAADPNELSARHKVFKAALGKHLQGPVFQDDAANVADIVKVVNGEVGWGERFDEGEVREALREMDRLNFVM